MSLRIASSVALAAALSAGGGGGAFAAPNPSAVLKTLRPGHPRLIVLSEDVTRARRLSETDAVAGKYRADLQKEGENTLDDPPVEYKLKGPRLLDQSRLCLRRVYTLAALYRLDGDRKWVKRAKKELFAAAAFPDWNPSHFLDTAEMTHAFAIGYDWLHDALLPEERTLLRTAIVEKGLLPGKNVYESGKGWPLAHHNWNQVCNGGLSLGALAIADEEPELAAFILSAALKSLPTAMASFAPDGGWNEGPGYWAYTINYTVPLIAGLESALGSDFGIADAQGFDRTGAFRLAFIGPTKRPFNYADGGDGVTNGSAMMYWLGRRFQQPLLYTAGGGGALGLFWYQPAGPGAKAASVPNDVFFKGVDVAFLRSAWEDPDALFVGFKGGDNAANHSHLDLGTFVFDALGERWALELGGDNYNLPGYFNTKEKRWTYYRLRTEGQNTLVLDGKNQQLKAKAPLLAFVSKPETGYAVADLSEGYAPTAAKALRGVALVDSRRALLVQDEIEAPAPVEYVWAMHTRAEITASGSEATLTLNGKTVTARVLEPAGATFASESATPPEPQNQNAGIRKLVVRLPQKVTTARIAVLLTPQRGGGASRSAAVSVTPLADWIKAAGPLPALGGTLSAKK